MPARKKPDLFLLPPVYRFRVRVKPGFMFQQEVPHVWREIEVASNQTLYDLGQAIPLAFEFTDPHLWSYFMSNRAWDQATEVTMQQAGRMKIGETEYPGAAGKKEFLFLFDYGDEWHFGVKLVKTFPELDSDTNYPRVADKQGAAPPQYPDLEEDEEEDEEEEEDE